MLFIYFIIHAINLYNGVYDLNALVAFYGTSLHKVPTLNP